MYGSESVFVDENSHVILAFGLWCEWCKIPQTSACVIEYETVLASYLKETRCLVNQFKDYGCQLDDYNSLSRTKYVYLVYINHKD